MDIKHIDEVQTQLGQMLQALESAPLPDAAQRARDKRRMISAILEKARGQVTDGVVSSGDAEPTIVSFPTSGLDAQSTTGSTTVSTTETITEIRKKADILHAWLMLNAIHQEVGEPAVAAEEVAAAISSLTSTFDPFNMPPDAPATATRVQYINYCTEQMVWAHKNGQPNRMLAALVYFMAHVAVPDQSKDTALTACLGALARNGTLTPDKQALLFDTFKGRITTWGAWALKVISGTSVAPPYDFGAVMNDLKIVFDVVGSDYLDAVDTFRE